MKPTDYVYSIQDSMIRLRLFDNDKINQIKELGGKKKFLSKNWTIPFKNKNDLAKIVFSLCEIGLCFVGATHGWPPSAILEDLKENGLIKIGWKEIVWTKKNEYTIRERD